MAEKRRKWEMVRGRGKLTQRVRKSTNDDDSLEGFGA